MADIVCPLCKREHKGFRLDGTDGRLVCEKYGAEILLPDYAQSYQCPSYKKKISNKNI